MSTPTINNFAPGDHVRTRTGKCDAVVVSVTPASTPEQIAAFDRGERVTIARREFVTYRTLRDGAPFGPLRSTSPGSLTKIGSLTLVEAAEGGAR